MIALPVAVRGLLDPGEQNVSVRERRSFAHCSHVATAAKATLARVL
ncbi:hypothetical protein HF288_11675 [Acidithiobacillus caldus]|nr:hypothetical protein [Acidithiobacillus caldus]MBU2802021.1 hypothetical protein [Acidithiobacillus caldus]MBU2821968.1 hypothetical protein [Acidithiobacillus caldus]